MSTSEGDYVEQEAENFSKYIAKGPNDRYCIKLNAHPKER